MAKTSNKQKKEQITSLFNRSWSMLSIEEKKLYLNYIGVSIMPSNPHDAMIQVIIPFLNEKQAYNRS